MVSCCWVTINSQVWPGLRKLFAVCFEEDTDNTGLKPEFSPWSSKCEVGLHHPLPFPHQSLGDIPSCGQRFEMSAVINQLHLFQVEGLQNLLTGSVHDLQFFMAVYQDQRAAVNPLCRKKKKKSTIFSLYSTPLNVWLQCAKISGPAHVYAGTGYMRTFPKSHVRPIIPWFLHSHLCLFDTWVSNTNNVCIHYME